MLVGFIGIPNSGKTTLAAETFVRLKKIGVVSEFVVEIARQHIAFRRKNGDGILVLTDEDQEAIMEKQLNTEELMDSTDTITVSDSSPLNALMYMTEEGKNDWVVQKLAEDSLNSYDLLVLCEGDTNMSHSSDPNRVHGSEACTGLEAERLKLVDMIKTRRPDLPLIIGRKDDWMDMNGSLASIIAYRLVDMFYEKASK